MKKVLITGGQGDIAQAIRVQLEKEGKYDIRTPGKAELDVTQEDSVRRYIDTFVPDILVNNAGYVLPQSIRDCNLARDKISVEVNLLGVFNCSAVVLQANPKAQIINIGSSAATKVHATWSSYCATKAAVVMATQCWAEDGVDVVCISPGRTKTKMRKSLYPVEDASTLLLPKEFAAVVIKAIHHEYPAGSHINVNRQNYEEIIHG